MDAGEIREFDTPYALLQNPDGYFYKMAEQMGAEEFENLQRAASDAVGVRARRIARNAAKTADILNSTDVTIELSTPDRL